MYWAYSGLSIDDLTMESYLYSICENSDSRKLQNLTPRDFAISVRRYVFRI